MPSDKINYYYYCLFQFASRLFVIWYGLSINQKTKNSKTCKKVRFFKKFLYKCRSISAAFEPEAYAAAKAIQGGNYSGVERTAW